MFLFQECLKTKLNGATKMENSYNTELNAVMFKSMMFTYQRLLKKFSYHQEDQKMYLLFSNWNECKESIWQTHDLKVMGKSNV